MWSHMMPGVVSALDIQRPLKRKGQKYDTFTSSLSRTHLIHKNIHHTVLTKINASNFDGVTECSLLSILYCLYITISFERCTFVKVYFSFIFHFRQCYDQWGSCWGRYEHVNRVSRSYSEHFRCSVGMEMSGKMWPSEGGSILRPS